MRYSGTRVDAIRGSKDIAVYPLDISEDNYIDFYGYWNWKKDKKNKNYKYAIERDVAESDDGYEMYEIMIGFTENHPLYNINVDLDMMSSNTKLLTSFLDKFEKARTEVIFKLIEPRLLK